MAENGVRTTDFGSVVALDDVIGNYNGNTVRFSIGGLISLIGSRIGPSYQTRTLLYADLNWPDGAIGAVYGDTTPSRIGVYKKTGSSGTGSWSRIGDLPVNQATVEMLRLKANQFDLLAEVVLRADGDADNRNHILAETGQRIAAVADSNRLIAALSQGFRQPLTWDASSGSFPSDALAGSLYRVTAPGTVNGVSFVVGHTLVARVNAPSTTVYAGNWEKGDFSELLAALTVQPFLRITDLSTSSFLVAGQRAQVAGRGEFEIVPVGTYTFGGNPIVANGETVIDLTGVPGLQAFSTSIDVATEFKDDTRPIEWLRTLRAGDLQNVRLKCAGHRYEVNLSQTGTVNKVRSAGGVYAKPLEGDDGFLDFRATGAVAGGADHSANWDIACASSKNINLGLGEWKFNYKKIPANTYLKSPQWLCIIRPVGAGIRAALTANSESATATVDGITIDGPTFYGYVETDGGFQDADGKGQVHLLTLNGVRDCTIIRTKFLGPQGDCIYLGSGDIGGQERHNYNVKLLDSHLDGITNSNRNGLSVIDCDGLEVRETLFERLSWEYAPGAIDLEPNHIWNVIRNVHIHHNRFKHINAAGVGVLLNMSGEYFNIDPYSIKVNDNIMEGVLTAFSVASRAVDISQTTYASGIEFCNNVCKDSGRPFLVYGVRGLRICDNQFLGALLPAEVGYDAWGMVDLVFNRNKLYECGSDNVLGRAGVLFTDIDGLEANDNDFIDNGRANGSTGFCMEFVSGFTGTRLKLRRNGFYAPKGRTTRAIRMSGYTYDAATCIDQDNIYDFTTNFEFVAPEGKVLINPPSTGTWKLGQRIYNRDPSNGIFGWFVTSVAPLTWGVIKAAANIAAVPVVTTFNGTLSHTTPDQTQIYSGTMTGAIVGDKIVIAPKFNPEGCDFRGVIVAANTLRIYGINQGGVDQSFSNPQFNVWREPA